ncbi:ATP-binding protein [Thiolapillus sp.]|uniref:ATP-binding protein n=3 Tax=Thiolapillus sp. TaxID=2017437 RepID=UPI003AF97EA4
MKRRFGIRFKLLLVSLSLIAIPVAGYQFIREMETFLRDAQDHNLATTTQALALLVQDNPAFSEKDAGPDALYVHPYQPVIIDGYADDWQDILPLAQQFSSADGLAFQVLLRASPGYFHLLIHVITPPPRYAGGRIISYGRSNQVELFLVDDNGLSRSYLIAPRAPGTVITHRLNGDQPGPGDFRLQGEWQEIASGYNLEMRIPKRLMASGMSIRVMDGAGHKLATASMEDSHKAGRLIQPSHELKRIIANIDLPQSRIRITDDQGWVLTRSGNLEDTAPQSETAAPWLLRKIIDLILQHRAGDAPPIEENSVRLSGEPVISALQGKTATRRYRMPGSETLVIATTRPVFSDGKIRGAVMLEQTTGNILSLQNQAMQRLLVITFTLFVVVALALLGFASLLTSRIRRLHNQMEKTVAPDGRIIGEIQVSRSRDEIADLGQSFSSVLSRLQEYNRYLQAMASRLSHEFRTPLAIIRTSLENSSLVDDAKEKQAYLQRAQKGVDRLELILRQLQEATQLEKALEQVEVQPFDLCELLAFSLENYASIHPGLTFELQPCVACRISGSPELVHQALEKLLDNAVDFHQSGTPIAVRLVREQQQVFVCVSNQGPAIPPNMDLFQSMVSLREKRQEQPHLGLGLYLVKLIAEFHGGGTRMENRPDEKAVSFCFGLRLDAN